MRNQRRPRLPRQRHSRAVNLGGVTIKISARTGLVNNTPLVELIAGAIELLREHLERVRAASPPEFQDDGPGGEEEE